MDYSFNGEIAAMYGVDEAVFIHNLYWWIKKNQANGNNFFDGQYWTYNSIDAFCVLFPYWSKRQVERILKSLKEKGAIVTGNYNKAAYDRTTWYALTETVISIYAKSEMHITKRGNGFTQTVTTIPDSKPYSKPNIKPDVKGTTAENDLDRFPPEVKTALLDWFIYKAERKESYKPKGRESFLSSVRNKLKQYKPAAVVDVIQNSMANNWKGVIWDTIDKTAVAAAEPVLIPKAEKDFFEMTPEEMFG